MAHQFEILLGILTKINNIELKFGIHVDISAAVVNGASVRGIFMRVETSLIAISNDRHAAWSCQPEYPMFPISFYSN